MARPKKPTYEWIVSRKEIRKRIKGPNGKYIALYAQTPEELTEKIAVVQRQIEEEVYRRENPTVKDYAEKWLTMQAAHIRATTLADYTSKVKIYINCFSKIVLAILFYLQNLFILSVDFHAYDL